MTKTDLRRDDLDTMSPSRSRARDTAGSARARASEAYRSARERTGEFYTSARDRASDAGRRAGDSIGSNPVGAVIGALAIGGIVAALLPKTRREVRAFGAAGARLNDKAREAAKSATDAGREKLDELGYATVKQKIGEIVGGKKSEA
ncbi:MAG TPA: hypothetical protein VI381_00945 [Allosphingosinicella sp.]